MSSSVSVMTDGRNGSATGAGAQSGRSPCFHGVPELLSLTESSIIKDNTGVQGYNIGMRPKGSPEELERRRIRALQLVEAGESPHDVARILGVTPFYEPLGVKSKLSFFFPVPCGAHLPRLPGAASYFPALGSRRVF
jgi:hypothetical protein